MVVSTHLWNTPFSQPLPMGFFQGFLSQLVLPGELQKTGVFDIAHVGSWIFFAGNPFNNGKKPFKSPGETPPEPRISERVQEGCGSFRCGLFGLVFSI